jgi:ElaB/YqjD/DUF883 family membrane-anchored ribosome-binding protein
MAGDVVVSRELDSLKDELLSVKRERMAAPVPQASATPSAAPPQKEIADEPARETGNERELRDQLHALMKEATVFFEEAEKSISTHPVQSIVGALLVGILIGRLLGGR